MNGPLGRVTAATTAACMLMTINGSGVTALRPAVDPASMFSPSRPAAGPYGGTSVPWTRSGEHRAGGPVVSLAQAPAGGGGEPGLGDDYFPNAGNEGYDVAEYQVDLHYKPKTGQIDAIVTVTAKAMRDLSGFNLDFRGPEITDLIVDGLPAPYRRHGQELTITPMKPLSRDESFTTVVRYSGRPQASHTSALGTYGWVSTPDGAIVASQPDGASTWIPVNDHPRDKAAYIFRITVPKGLQVLASGEPHPPVPHGAMTTHVWTERAPMASYLAMVAIGEFEIRRGQVGDIPVITAVDPRFGKAADRLHATTVAALQWGIQVFGDYPFRTAGGIIDDAPLGYALETQERPVYLGFAPDERFIVHELAHQWFGNSVSLWRWRDIWLNEGFAAYAEWLWREHTGQETAANAFERYYRRSARSSVFSSSPGSPGAHGLFSASTYARGAMCLQALRARIGDDKFFRILREWPAAHRYGNATIPEFIVFAEKIAGMRLDRLFTAWLYKRGKPAR
jgi:aminopeptidase N